MAIKGSTSNPLSFDCEIVDESKRISPWRQFIAGGVGGMCLAVLGHPVDTIKVRLQTMPKTQTSQSPLYTGAFDCAKKIIVEEGVRGLYRGMSATLTAVAPLQAVSFFSYGIGKKLQQAYPNEALQCNQLFLAGMLSGVLTTFVLAPGERIKCLLQVQQSGGVNATNYAGPGDCAKRLYRTGGIRSLYKGTCVTLLRDVPAAGVFFSTYEVLQRTLEPLSGNRRDLRVAATLVSGGTAGAINWLMVTPVDVLKSRLQCAPEGRYRGIRDVFRETISAGGVSAFYKDSTPVMLGVFIANAACFLGFEATLRALNPVCP